MSIKRILVPVDFSPAMDCVIGLARASAEAFEAELHLVHVREIATVPIFPAATIGYPGVGLPEMGMPGPIPMGEITPLETANMPAENKSPLESLRGELLRRQLQVFAHEPEGAVVGEILKLAGDVSADLIIMGSHGHGAMYNLLVGSVTEGVLKAGSCPVLLVPSPTRKK